MPEPLGSGFFVSQYHLLGIEELRDKRLFWGPSSNNENFHLEHITTTP
jgi:hypothetical protein